MCSLHVLRKPGNKGKGYYISPGLKIPSLLLTGRTPECIISCCLTAWCTESLSPAASHNSPQSSRNVFWLSCHYWGVGSEPPNGSPSYLKQHKTCMLISCPINFKVDVNIVFTTWCGCPQQKTTTKKHRYNQTLTMQNAHMMIICNPDEIHSTASQRQISYCLLHNISLTA